MTESTAATQVRTRWIVHRTFGDRRGPITRLMSPSDLGRRLKPFVFLDLFDGEESSLSGFGWHPHSGIATRKGFGDAIWRFVEQVARMERSEIRACFVACEKPGLRCAPSGLRAQRGGGS